MSDQAEQLTEKAGDEIPSKKSKARTETKSSDKKGSTKSVPGHSREPKDQNVSTALAKLQQRSVQRDDKLDSMLTCMEEQEREVNSRREEQDKANQGFVETLTMMQNQMVESRKESKQILRKLSAKVTGSDRVKTQAPSPAKKSRMSQFTDPSDEDEQEAEDGDSSDQEDDDKESVYSDEQEDKLLGHSKRVRLEVSTAQVEAWTYSRKLSQEWGDENWKQLKASNLVSLYSGHQTAKLFRAHDMDTEAPALKFESAKTAETNMKGQEQLLGAIGAAATHVLSLVTDIASAVKKMEKDVGAKQDDLASFQEKAVFMLKDTQDGLKELTSHSEKIVKTRSSRLQ